MLLWSIFWMIIALNITFFFLISQYFLNFSKTSKYLKKYRAICIYVALIWISRSFYCHNKCLRLNYERKKMHLTWNWSWCFQFFLEIEFCLKSPCAPQQRVMHINLLPYCNVLIGYRKSCSVVTGYGFHFSVLPILIAHRWFDSTVSDKIADLTDYHLRNIKGSYSLTQYYW